MNVTGIKQTSGAMPASQPKQDSHEKSIQNQIVSLQEKMRNLTNDVQMPAEEKTDEKKELQEKIQDLNSELKQYQVQKRQEEALKRQEEEAKQQEKAAKAQEEAARQQAQAERAAQSAASGNPVSGNAEDVVESALASIDEAEAELAQTGSSEFSFPDEDARVMITLSNTKEMLSNMNRIRTNLEGRIRTMESDDEKLKLQKRMVDVSKGMGENVQKIADSISDNQKDAQERKDKVTQSLKDYRERSKNMNVVVSGSAKSSAVTNSYFKDDSSLRGKVLITRKKV